MTLDALRLERIALVGMSFGGWIALTYAIATPARVQQLVLLSPGGLLPLRKQFHLRGMAMMFLGTRFAVNSLMRWVGIVDRPGETTVQPVFYLIYLGLKHFRMPSETARIMPTPSSDDELRSMHMPVRTPTQRSVAPVQSGASMISRVGVLIMVLAASLARAQTSPATPHVIGMVHFIHATQTLETTVAFYRDVFGIDAPIRPFTNPAVATLNNVPGIKLRASRPVFPDNSAWEITEFTEVDRTGGQARPTDPGAIALMIPVRDLDAVTAAAKKAGAPILSRSGGPVAIKTPRGSRRALVLRDPDGFLAWAIEVPASEATSEGIVQRGVSMVVVVKDLEMTAKFYRDLGFDLNGSLKFRRDAALTDLLGLPSTSDYRELSGSIPGTNASRVLFYEWKGMPRTPFHLNVYDYGAGGFVLRVTGLDAMVANMKAQGLRVISAGGGPVPFGPTSRNVFVVDINGMNLELTESAAPPRASAPAPK